MGEIWTPKQFLLNFRPLFSKNGRITWTSVKICIASPPFGYDPFNISENDTEVATSEIFLDIFVNKNLARAHNRARLKIRPDIYP